jgi:hypothetical protein
VLVDPRDVSAYAFLVFVGSYIARRTRFYFTQCVISLIRRTHGVGCVLRLMQRARNPAPVCLPFTQQNDAAVSPAQGVNGRSYLPEKSGAGP